MTVAASRLAAVLDRLEARHSWLEVIHHRENRGRGAALRTAYRAAGQRGMTHFVQLDADGQHTATDVPRFLEAARAQPDALVLGCADLRRFDPVAPATRSEALEGHRVGRNLVYRRARPALRIPLHSVEPDALVARPGSLR